MNKKIVLLLAVLVVVFAVYLWGRAGFPPNVVAGISEEFITVIGQDPYGKSLSVWESLKEENGDTYYYTTSFSSWSGFGRTKTIQVTDGSVSSQTTVEYRTDNNCRGTDCRSTETTVLTSEEITEMSENRRPQTMDEIYAECKEDVLSRDPDGNVIRFETHENGILMYCEYRPSGCMDDCNFGVSVGTLEFGEAPE